MKTFTSKTVGVLLIIIAGLLLANLATMWVQRAGAQAQQTQPISNVVPLASGAFAASTPPGCPGGCFWSMYLIVRADGTREACFISFNPADVPVGIAYQGTMTHRCVREALLQPPR
jgi:hypothetical protein